jgi:hypothetical protein
MGGPRHVALDLPYDPWQEEAGVGSPGDGVQVVSGCGHGGGRCRFSGYHQGVCLSFLPPALGARRRETGGRREGGRTENGGDGREKGGRWEDREFSLTAINWGITLFSSPSHPSIPPPSLLLPPFPSVPHPTQYALAHELPFSTRKVMEQCARPHIAELPWKSPKRLKIFKWLVKQQGCEIPKDIYELSQKAYDLKIFHWLGKHGKFKTPETGHNNMERISEEKLQWLVDNGKRLDESWSTPESIQVNLFLRKFGIFAQCSDPRSSAIVSQETN